MHTTENLTCPCNVSMFLHMPSCTSLTGKQKQLYPKLAQHHHLSIAPPDVPIAGPYHANIHKHSFAAPSVTISTGTWFQPLSFTGDSRQYIRPGCSAGAGPPWCT